MTVKSLKVKVNPFDKLRVNAEQRRSINPFDKLRVNAEQRRSIKSFSDGFTLVELLVGIGFFSMVMIVLTSAFLATFRSQRAGFAFLSAQNNVRFVFEVMAREMRTGVGFSLLAPNRIRFTNDRDQLVEYCLGGMAIRKATGAACDDSSPPMTASSVTVENLAFILTGKDPGDSIQPRVTIVAKITSGNASADVQTTVTQRELDS